MIPSPSPFFSQKSCHRSYRAEVGVCWGGEWKADGNEEYDSGGEDRIEGGLKKNSLGTVRALLAG